METTLDSIIDLGSDLKANIILLLTCVVEYKGFLAMVQPNMKFKPERMIYGLKKNKFINDENLIQGLSKIGKKLNIQSHAHKTRAVSGSLVEVPITQNLQIYKTMKYTLESLLARTDSDIKWQMEKLNMNKDDKLLELNEETDIFYLTQLMNIFPHDLKLQEQTYDSNNRKRFRPEFMKTYGKQLNPDTLENLNLQKKQENMKNDLTEAHQVLTSKYIQNLVIQLDRMEFLAIDSHNLTKIFHKYGVNMRYLGKVAEESNLPHIRILCVWEMLARSMARMFNFWISEFILNAGNAVSDAEEIIYPNKSRKTKELLDLFDGKLKMVAFNFLNKAFGKLGSQINKNKEFWGIELYKQVEYDFEYQLEVGEDCQNVNDFQKGYLLNAFVYHTGLDLRQKGYLGLGVEDCPIDLEDILGFKTRPKVFKFKTHKLRQISENYQEHMQSERYSMALKLLAIKMSIEESMGRVYEYLDTLGEMADIQIKLNEFDAAIITCSKALEILSPYSPQ